MAMAEEREFPRPLPKNREAEQVVLGAALLEPEETLPLIAPLLKPEDFYWQAHQAIYRTVLELWEKGRPPDLIVVADRLEELQLLQAIGGRVYLSELIGSVTTTTSVEYYAQIVKKKATLRALIEAGKAVTELGYREEEELEEVLDRAEETIFSISRFGTKPGYHLISEFIHEHISNLEKLHRDPERRTVTGLSTGFRKFDEMTAGLQPSDLIVIAGRPAMGKCLRGDQRILDPSTGALVPIARFTEKEDKTVLALGEDYKLVPAPVIRALDSGLQPTYRVVTSSGREIVVTANHPFLTLKGWRELYELRPGDRIATPRRLPAFGTKHVPAHRAKLLGYLLGDGALGRSSVLFTNKNPKIIEEFKACVEAFPCATTCQARVTASGTITLRVIKDEIERRRVIEEFKHLVRAGLQAKGLSLRRLSLKLGLSTSNVQRWFKTSSLPRDDRLLMEIQRELDIQLPIEALSHARRNDLNSVAKWLRELGLLGRRAEEKYIPDEVFTWDRESLRLFLNRLFACDGSLYAGRRLYGLSFSSTSKELAKGVQHLLLRFGILTKLRGKRVRHHGGERTVWEVEARDLRNIQRFVQEIGIYGAEDRVRLVLEALERRGSYNMNIDTIPLEAESSLSWRDLNLLIGYPANHDHHMGQRGLSRDKLEKTAHAIQAQTVLLECPSSAEALIALSRSDIFWDRIESIEEAGIAPTYDLEIPGAHNFVAEDIIVHNSSLAISIARNAALRDGRGVGLFSLEMTKEQLLERLICGEAKINLYQLRSGYLPAEKWRGIVEAAGKLAKSRIVIDDTPGISVMELKARARRMKAEYDIDLLFVDYLQLVESGLRGTNTTREQEISHIARSLKALARELQIPVVACSQLSRAVERREAKKPRLSDLRECLTGDTLIYHALTGRPYTLKELYEAQALIPVHTVTPQLKLGLTLPAKVVCSGVKPVFRLRTRTGREIRASAEHPFLTIAGWRKLEDLRPGERIAVPSPRRLPPSGNGRLTEEEACLLGYLIADGGYRRRGMVMVGLINADPEVIRDACDIVRKRFGIPAHTEPHWSGTQVEFSVPGQYGPGRNPLTNWLKSLGIHGELTIQKRIPQMICEASPRVVAAFIGGLYPGAGDGSLWRELELSYRCQGKKISRFHPQRVPQELNDLWLEQLAISDLLWDQIISIEPAGEELTYDLVIPGTHNFVANDLVVHNSGEIEQTADVVIFIYRESYYEEERGEVSPTEIIIGKQRNGPTGSFTLSFHRSYASFYEFTPEMSPF